MALEEGIKAWVSLDNQIRKLGDQLQRLRAKRSEIAETVLSEAQDKHLLSSRVRVSDGYLRFARARTSPPLSLKYIETCLTRCIPDADQSAKIMRFIKEARPIKEETTIRRIVQNPPD